MNLKIGVQERVAFLGPPIFYFCVTEHRGNAGTFSITYSGVQTYIYVEIYIYIYIYIYLHGTSVVKNLPAKQGLQVWSLSQKDPLEKETATHSSIIVWAIPWTEEPGGLYSPWGSKRVGLKKKKKSWTWLSN